MYERKSFAGKMLLRWTICKLVIGGLLVLNIILSARLLTVSKERNFYRDEAMRLELELTHGAIRIRSLESQTVYYRTALELIGDHLATAYYDKLRQRPNNRDGLYDHVATSQQVILEAIDTIAQTEHKVLEVILEND